MQLLSLGMLVQIHVHMISFCNFCFIQVRSDCLWNNKSISLLRHRLILYSLANCTSVCHTPASLMSFDTPRPMRQPQSIRNLVDRWPSWEINASTYSYSNVWTDTPVPGNVSAYTHLSKSMYLYLGKVSAYTRLSKSMYPYLAYFRDITLWEINTTISIMTCVR